MDERILSYYKRKDVQNAILSFALDKEIGVLFPQNQFGRRPEILVYSGDVLEFAKQGATSFHCSEELWHNPLQIKTGMRKNELDILRKGWDLILDIDCKILEYSQIAGDLLVKAIKSKGITSVTAKFSGNHGFHIAVPFETFPENIRTNEVAQTKCYFPDGVRIIAAYLKEMIKEPLANAILAKEDISIISEKTQKPFEELVEDGGLFNPFAFLEIDSVLISSRHLYRMPYSLNEKSGLVSIPVDPAKILEFNKEDAKIENVIVGKFPFLDRTQVQDNEALHLFDSAIGWGSTKKEHAELNEQFLKQEKASKHVDIVLTESIPQDLFPPCMKQGLQGIIDGKKRFLFALMNFLSKAGWSQDQIAEKVDEWNKKNPEALRETIIQTQVRYHGQRKEKMLPPNCRSFYQDLRVCKPDGLCDRIKNPVNYSLRRAFAQKMQEQDGRKRKEKPNSEKINQEKVPKEKKIKEKTFREKKVKEKTKKREEEKILMEEEKNTIDKEKTKEEEKEIIKENKQEEKAEEEKR